MKILGRNDICLCGSGKKHKQCCMQKDALRDAEKARRVNEISQKLHIAMTLSQAGRVTEAEAIYRQILQHTPHHPDALYLLGMIAHQAGNNDLAADLITQAIAASPPIWELHHNLGVILQKLDRFDEALENYRLAVNFNKNWQATLHRLTTPLVLRV